MASLTSGSVSRHFLRLTTANTVAVLVINGFVFLEVMVAAVLIGPVAVGGVAVGSNILGLTVAATIAWGMSMVTALARFVGRGEREAALRLAGHAVLISTAAALLVGLAIGGLRHEIAGLYFRHDAQSAAAAASYLVFFVIAVPAAMFAVACNSVQRAFGEAARPMQTNIVGAVAGMVLLGAILAWGYASVAALGAALAASRVAMALHAGFSLIRHYGIRFRVSDLAQTGTWGLLKPVFLSQLLVGIGPSLSWAVILAYAAGFGTIVTATISILSRIELLIATPLSAFSNSAAAIAGQNLGAGVYQRVHALLRVSFISAIAYALAMWGLALALLSIWPTGWERLASYDRSLAQLYFFALLPLMAGTGVFAAAAAILAAAGGAKNVAVLAVLRSAIIIVIVFGATPVIGTSVLLVVSPVIGVLVAGAAFFLGWRQVKARAFSVR